MHKINTQGEVCYVSARSHELSFNADVGELAGRSFTSSVSGLLRGPDRLAKIGSPMDSTSVDLYTHV